MIDYLCADYFADAVETFKNRRLSSRDGSERAWEHCTLAFHNVRKTEGKDKVDYLALQLGMFLANFGMYRSTTLLSKFDYTVHKGAVEIILDRRFDSLDWILCEDYSSGENGGAFEEIVKELRKHYKKARNRIVGKMPGVTDTLISKVLMGTLCCTPAYDSYVTRALCEKSSADAKFTLASVRRLSQLYSTLTMKCNSPKLVDDTNERVFDYPQMRVLDIGLWQIGYWNSGKGKREGMT